MRITENMKFRTTINHIFNIESQYNGISEKIASTKQVNRASDNPVAATKIIELNQILSANKQFKTNIDSCNAWISATESKLSGAYDLLVSAQEIAVRQATATASDTTRKTAAQNVEALIEEMASLANAKLGDRYLFSGSRSDAAPFSTVVMNPTIEAAGAAAGNQFQGTVTSSGTYSGTVNQTYAVKITQGGVLDTATCQFSVDGGRTWNGTDISLSGGSVNVGDGVVLTFDDSGGTTPLGEQDVFYVSAITGGYYCGNEEDLNMTVNRGTPLVYNIKGSDAFTAQGSEGIDIFATLNALKDALNNDDTQGITDLIDQLKSAQTQVTQSQSLCGARANHTEIVANNLSDLDTQTTSLLSSTQDADLTDLATQLSMKELALKASFSIASKIGDTTILDYIR